MSLRRWTRLLGRWALTVLALLSWLGGLAGLALILTAGAGALSDTTPGRMWAVWLLLVAACLLALLADRTRPDGVLA
ncbi:hypothetical protein, partial [Actinoplanes philippinensis]|uniref:hypothetical protein n=1 Tax=Actinoplanes philippinensis TaxID=35752 RepID=UPI00340B8EF9